MLRRAPKWTIIWHGHVLSEAIAAADAALPRETGGIIVGWYRDDEVHVERFIEVPDPEADDHGYIRRAAEAEAILDDFLGREGAGTELGYVGEWHAHPRPQPASPTDLSSLSSIAGQVDEPVVMVVLSHHLDGWEANSYVKLRRRPRRHRSKNGAL